MMLTDVERVDVSTQVMALMTRHEVPFQRGNVIDFFGVLGPFLEGFTVSSLDHSARLRSARIKYIFTMWNVVVDDDIDRMGSANELLRSLSFLSHVARVDDHVEWTPGTPAQWLLHAMFLELADIAPWASWRHLVFGVYKHAMGFYYEWLANHYDMANSAEYTVFSTLTTDLTVYVDIDRVVSGDELRDVDYARLRSACLELSRAVKYASDVGSLEREVVDEANHNFITIRHWESSGRRPRDKTEYAREIEESTALASEALTRAKRKLAALDPARFDVRPLVESVDEMVSAYLQGDPFFGRSEG